ncbi:MAG: insulinase family protein [bacterium]|nr:insulinase family protein [bacterium]
MRDIFAFRCGVTKHGLRVFVKSMRIDPPQVSAGLVMFAGVRQDPPEMPGLSHAVEHAMGIAGSDSGDVSKARRYAIERGFLPEDLGSTGAESTWWMVRGVSLRLREMLRFLAVYARVFPKHLSITHLQEIHQRELAEVGPRTTPVHRAILRAAFPEGHPVLRVETSEGINRWTAGAIKDHFVRYHTLPNMALVVAGSTTFSEVMRAAAEAFPKLPHDGDAKRTIVAPMAASPIRCGQYVVRPSDVLGLPSNDDEPAGECSVLRMRATPLTLMHEQRAMLCVNVAASACFATLREKLGIVYAVRPTIETFRDLRFCRLGVDAAPDHFVACAEAFKQIPELVKRRGRKWFEVERDELLLGMRLKQVQLSGLVLATLIDLSIFGCVQTQEELVKVIETTTWADAVAGVEELFAPDRSLMVSIVP